jgi:hypothetical protein
VSIGQDVAVNQGDSHIAYEGAIYVAPVGRGVTLLEPDGQPTLDEVVEETVAERYGPVSGWTGRARIRIEILEELPDQEL